MTTEHPSQAEARQSARSNAQQLSSLLADSERHAREFMRERPLVAVLAAVGVGYAVARLVAGRRSES